MSQKNGRGALSAHARPTTATVKAALPVTPQVRPPGKVSQFAGSGQFPPLKYSSACA
jgi:hypothetical protein